MTKRQKTNTDVNVPLLDIPKMILKKYKGKLPDGKILPIISNQKLNAYLKEIADVCGIKKNLTFHVARHTFGTMMLTLGVDLYTVSKLLGHTKVETTVATVDHDSTAQSAQANGRTEDFIDRVFELSQGCGIPAERMLQGCRERCSSWLRVRYFMPVNVSCQRMIGRSPSNEIGNQR